MINKLAWAWHYATTGNWCVDFKGSWTHWEYDYFWYDGHNWIWFLGPLRVGLYY